MPEPEQEPTAASGSTAIDAVKNIIAEQTGYTADMLEHDLDLEADLGIDTVKQVEIFGNIASHFEFSVPDDLKLRDLNTIAKLAEYIGTKVELPASPVAATQPSEKKASEKRTHETGWAWPSSRELTNRS